MPAPPRPDLKLPKCVREGCLRHGGVRGRRPKLKVHNAAGPVKLVAKHRRDDLRNSSAGCSGSGACAAVMGDRRYSRKEHVVAHIAHRHAGGGVVDDVETRTNLSRQ